MWIDHNFRLNGFIKVNYLTAMSNRQFVYFLLEDSILFKILGDTHWYRSWRLPRKGFPRFIPSYQSVHMIACGGKETLDCNLLKPFHCLSSWSSYLWTKIVRFQESLSKLYQRVKAHDNRKILFQQGHYTSPKIRWFTALKCFKWGLMSLLGLDTGTSWEFKS